MPQIPDFTAVGMQTPQPSLTPRVPVDESGDIIERGVDELAGAVRQAGAQIQQKQHADAITAASNQLSDFRIANQTALATAKQNADPQSLTGFAPAVLQDFDKRANALLSGASPLARPYLQAGLNDERTRVGVDAAQWADTQRTAVNTQSVLDNVDKLAPLVTADPSRQGNIGGQLMAQVNASGLPPAQQAQLRTHVAQSLAMAAGQGVVQQDPLGMLNRLNDPNDTTYTNLSPQQRAALSSYAQGQAVDQHAQSIASTFANMGVRAGSAQLDNLGNSGLPPDLQDQVRQKVNGLVNQLHEDRSKLYAPQLAQLEQNIASGKPTAADSAAAWDLYDKNAIAPEQLASTLGSIERAQLKSAADGVALQTAMDAYQNNPPRPMDPKDADSRAAVDALFQRLTTGAQPGTPAYVNRAVDMADRVGVVPDSAVSWARANLAAGNPQVAAQSADLLARIDETVPGALDYGVDPKTRAMADSISQAVRAGTPAQVAVDMARQNASLLKDQLTDLQTKWQTLKASTGQAGALQTMLKAEPSFKQGFFSSLPAVPTAMQADFDNATRNYFDYTGGNLQQARQLAARDVSRVYGISHVNGTAQILPYAPEHMFPGLTTQTVRADIADTVQTSAQAFQHLDPATGNLVSASPAAADVQLIPTDRTARTGGLEWSLGAPDQFGAMDILRGKDGNPLVYRLPVSQPDFDRVRQQMAQASIEKARQLEQQRQQQTAAMQFAFDESVH